MKYGYAHVSAADQNADQQLKALRKAGCQKLFTDHEAAGTAKRPELDRALKALKAGDTLVVWKLDRLARTLHGLLEIVDDLHQCRVNLLSLMEGLSTSTPGNLIFHVFSAFAPSNGIKRPNECKPG